ncbi:MAG: hypothetical protein ACYTG7_13330 [Planctomycetota bacterium]
MVKVFIAVRRGRDLLEDGQEVQVRQAARIQPFLDQALRLKAIHLYRIQLGEDIIPELVFDLEFVRNQEER